MATIKNTKVRAEDTRFCRYRTVLLIRNRNSAARAPPRTGEITQLAAILPITLQSAIPQPPAAMPAPSTPPTMECVVDTGAPSQVARFSHRAPASNAAVISQTNVWVSPTLVGSIIPFLIVETTSPPAIIAPEASKTAASSTAAPSDSAPEPTAGPTLFATSLAPILIAMYPPITAAAISRVALGRPSLNAPTVSQTPSRNRMLKPTLYRSVAGLLSKLSR